MDYTNTRAFQLALNLDSSNEHNYNAIQSAVSVVYPTSHEISLQWRHNGRYGVSNHQPHDCLLNRLLSGVPDYFGRNKILSGYDLSHIKCLTVLRVFFYFVWFMFIHHNFQFYFELCTYCNILDIYLS